MNNRLLFHYTTADGAIGIIKNKSLWATDIKFLNDSEEFIHGCKIVEEITNQLQSGDIEHNFDSVFLRNLLDAAKSLASDEYHSVSAYIISLSEEDDSLSQWRAYSADSGYALGWEVDKLRKLAKLRGARLVKCIYDEGEQRKFVRRIIKFISHKVKNEKFNLLESCIKSYTIKYILQRFMPRLKHAAFKDEKEWRIVVTNNKNINFRSGRFGVVPYVEYSIANDSPEIANDFPESVIRNIFMEHENIYIDHKNIYMPDNLTVGPCENQMLAKIGIQHLLMASEKIIVNNNLSKLPYRHMSK